MNAEAKKTARPLRGAPFFLQQAAFVVKQRMRHALCTRGSGKKIPAFRRANDTLFNVSERSAR
ncbi:hypothetical protein [Paraburkholderia haematera]|uniref:hypothetical protein n=1 Tax=Paraburkholderia haematera TaxID=2793077 RepID=UPI001B8CCDA2|nr:hypothetical protein [Paraburkholderia haematera]